MPKSDWNDLPLLLALHRAGDLAGAARALGLDETTVSRRLTRAERTLGLTLAVRRRGALDLTEAGQALADHAARAAEMIDQGLAAARRQAGQVLGSVRITAVPWIVNRVLLPNVRDLTKAHPALTLDLISESRDLSLDRRQADIALRLARPATEQAVLARRVATLTHAVYGPAQEAPEPLPWLTYTADMQHLPPARWMDTAPGEPGPLRLADVEALIAAVEAGLGRAVLPRRAAEGAPGLQPLDIPGDLTRELWLMVHPDIADTARIRTVIGWIEACLSGA